MFGVSGLSGVLSHLTRRKNAQGAIDYSFSVSLVHQDLGIDEAASENKLFPLWVSTQKNKSEVGGNIQPCPNQRDSGIDPRAPSCWFLLETNLWVWKFYSVSGRVCVSDGFMCWMN